MADIRRHVDALVKRILDGDGRLADTFELFVPKSFAFSAKILLGRGYRM